MDGLAWSGDAWFRLWCRPYQTALTESEAFCGCVTARKTGCRVGQDCVDFVGNIRNSVYGSRPMLLKRVICCTVLGKQ